MIAYLAYYLAAESIYMPRKTKDQTNLHVNFEQALIELNQLVETMEQGGLSLEQSLQNFERGVLLVKQCQQAIQEAEQKIQILTEKNAIASLEPYDDEP